MATSVRPVDYARWDNFADSDEEEERPTQAERISAHIDLEHTQRVNEQEDELAAARAQLAALRQQRKALDEATRAQSSTAVGSSQWMLIGGSSFARVPSQKVAQTLANEQRKVIDAIRELEVSVNRLSAQVKRLRSRGAT
ncbi:hypothetical protein KFE25_006626 [Diacronema lutheri]|uniref:P53 and DNA damage-regulated protein 1 n=1 Tax=Diacronema lutheri TaxID=2081491 RepID=A0A8J6CCH7_DIALT|nr:hypothetical protein KFE25_006626 [Diacronema lutheri]